MSYEQLEQAGYIKKVRFRRRHIHNYLRAAVRDLETARHNLGKSNDWAFAIAYSTSPTPSPQITWPGSRS